MSLADTLDSWGDRLRGLVSGLAPRERVLVAITAVVMLSFAGFFANKAMDASTKRLKNNINQTSLAQGQIDTMLTRHSELQMTAEALDSRLEAGRGFAPLTWIEEVGNEMNIPGNIRSVNERGQEQTDYYSAQTIDMVVDDVDLRQTIDLLYRFETAPQAIRINDLKIKADRKNRAQLDLRIELAVLSPLGAP